MITKILKICLLFVLASLFFVIPTISFAQDEEINPEAIKNALDQNLDFEFSIEKIKNFDVEIKIEKDSSIQIREAITYDFGTFQKHGIFRFIPYKYKARGGNFTLRISELKASDEKGNPYQYTTSKKSKNVEIKIGDPNVTITGVHTYVITYKVLRAINYFTDHDELYWNATGNEWLIPIETSKAKVILPEAVPQEKMQLKCYTGILGSQAEDCGAKVLSDKEVLFDTKGELGISEGLTIVFGWPKGVVSKPSLSQKLIWILQDNYYLGFPVLVFLFSYVYWYKHGRDPKKRKVIVVEYEPPDNLTPAEVGTLYNDSVENKDITANLIELARRGYLKIRKTGEDSKDFQFIKLKDGNDLKNDFEKTLLSAIFGLQSKKDLADLEEKFYKNINTISNQIYESLTDKGYYAKNPNRAKFGCLFTFGILASLLGFFLGFTFMNFFLGASIVSSGIIMIIFSQFMSKKTIQGVRTLEKILGFKEFLKVTEEERLKFHNPPDMVPELFERFLAYAMVLGVENEWAGNFSGIYKQAPSWYEGYGPTTWSSIYLANSMSTFSDRASTVFVSAPKSTAAGGGSGFSGGGGSGGGGGGGGGGSW